MQIGNYNLLHNNISLNDAFDYNELMSLVNNVLPSDFFKKYCNIQIVIVSGKVTDQYHLVEFLKSSDYLRELRFENSLLDQSFYDNRLHRSTN